MWSERGNSISRVYEEHHSQVGLTPQTALPGRMLGEACYQDSLGQWIKRLWYIYTMEYYLTIQKNEIVPFATAWMDLEDIVLSEISQR